MKNMKNRPIVFFIVIALVLSLCACAASSVSQPSDEYYTTATADVAMDTDSVAGMKNESSYVTDRTDASVMIPADISSLPDQDRKLILTANITMQTTEFDQTIEKVKAMVKAYGGYFERSSTYMGGYFDEVRRKSADMGARIPADQYEAFMSEVSDVAYISNKSENGTDVSEQYFDLESRLKTLRIQQDKYTQMLEKADTMADSIEIEKALSDVLYQIESYTTTLEHLNGQVDYSTVNIYVEEVYQISDEGNMPKSFVERLSNSFLSTGRKTLNLLEDIIIGLISLLPVLIILIPVVLIVWLIVRRKRKKREPDVMIKQTDKEE